MNISLYLLVHLLTLGFSYYVFRIVVRRDYQKRGKLSNFASILEFLIFGIHANISYTFLPAPYPEIPPLPENIFLRVIGLGMIGLGMVFAFGTMGNFGFKKAVGQNTKTLRRAGFYRFTRNPQIVFFGIALSGIAVLWFSIYALGWMLVYVAIAQMMILTEEEHLLQIYGDEYAAYCEEVPRYFPSLR